MARILSRLTFAAAMTWLPYVATAQTSGQRTFASAGEASQALAYAVQGDDRQALTGILGADTNLIGRGDDTLDQADRRLFVEKYQQMHRLTKEADGDVLLFIGAENWPFPVPLVSNGGRWYFDADAGKQEVVLRRIGENELEAVALSEDLGHAAHDSTAALVSPTPMHGYYYRVLDSRGTVVAYPAAYRSSGVMTFLVNPNGDVYERDLGPHTEQIASALRSATPGNGWRRVQ